jgi:hypothetical protein
MYLFNPNFITDYKGYKLGMSISDWSAFAFRRKQVCEFSKKISNVTKVSDSLLNVAYFKFPG